MSPGNTSPTSLGGAACGWGKGVAGQRSSGSSGKIARTYDEIAERYRETKAIPFQRFLVTDTLLRLVGDVAGMQVLDLACGEGHYTRRMKRAGAAHVLGVDVSAEMIRLAEAAFADVGLHGVSWERPSVSDEGLDAYPAGYWDRFLATPQFVGIRAQK